MKYYLFFKRKTHDELLNNKTFQSMMMTESVLKKWSADGVTVCLHESNSYENSVLEEVLKLADLASCKEKEVA